MALTDFNFVHNFALMIDRCLFKFEFHSIQKCQSRIAIIDTVKAQKLDMIQIVTEMGMILTTATASSNVMNWTFRIVEMICVSRMILFDFVINRIGSFKIMFVS